MIKAAFFDIDGTLVGFKTHRVPESAWRAIELMRAKGIKVCIASGRSLMEMHEELKTGFDAYVTMNGQLCFDDEGVFRDAHIDDRDVRVIVEQAREGLYDLYVMQGSRSFVNNLGDRVIELGRQVGENDLGMFEVVGTSIAMGNAWDGVKERASFVTTDVDADGIWNACKELGII